MGKKARRLTHLVLPRKSRYRFVSLRENAQLFKNGKVGFSSTCIGYGYMRGMTRKKSSESKARVWGCGRELSNSATGVS